MAKRLPVKPQLRDLSPRWIQRQDGVEEVAKGFWTIFGLENCFSETKMCATFKMILLRRQEELVGPSQHSTVRIT